MFQLNLLFEVHTKDTLINKLYVFASLFNISASKTEKIKMNYNTFLYSNSLLKCTLQLTPYSKLKRYLTVFFCGTKILCASIGIF